MRVGDLATGRLERTLEGHSVTVRAVAVTSDGARIVSGEERLVRVWNLASGLLERSFVTWATSIRAVVVTPDGARIVSGGGLTGGGCALQVWGP